MQDCKVSVIMGIYNCADTLGEAIDSIIDQTYPDWELIMCDDGSTDNTYQIAHMYQNRYPDKIVLLKNNTNRKLPYTLNRCLAEATGKYIARMDGDDRSRPNRFEEQVRFLEVHPEVDLVGTGMIYFNDGNIIGYRKAPSNPEPEIIGIGTPFFHGTIMMRSAVYRALNGYSLEPYVTRSEDIDLWIRFFASGYHGANLDQYLYCVREDFDAVKRRRIKDGFRLAKMLYISFNKYHYPKRQYIYILKPVISCLTPKHIKYLFNQVRWKV